MDISFYQIHEPLWIDFLENTFNNIKEPIKCNKFEDVSNLFSKYFIKNDTNVKKNFKIYIENGDETDVETDIKSDIKSDISIVVKKNSKLKKIIKKTCCKKINKILYNKIKQKEYRLKKKHNLLKTL